MRIALRIFPRVLRMPLGAGIAQVAILVVMSLLRNSTMVEYWTHAVFIVLCCRCRIAFYTSSSRTISLPQYQSFFFLLDIHSLVFSSNVSIVFGECRALITRVFNAMADVTTLPATQHNVAKGMGIVGDALSGLVCGFFMNSFMMDVDA